ncbi:rhomboid family protein [Reichenbachiella versicolor]|uniref:rhomboid family protein n=1 Tax=Reichenbachiella versicolor TaxID=1821036 RepID=UPI000D6E3036|nr:rhomboid family intramembrane serine protease [Reichenbachiella versicolor]
MNSFLDDFKNAWNRPNNALPQIIIINVIVFVFLVLLSLFSRAAGIGSIASFIIEQFQLPSRFSEFILRPWTLITYSFAHSTSGLMHILFNMLYLYWFGKLIVEYLGNQKLINLYVLGALTGGLMYLVVYNTVPGLTNEYARMVGASGAVYAITIAAATLLPNYTFYLMFLGPVKIKYIALFVLLSSLIGLQGHNVGGNVAHFGGAIMGYVYIKQLQQGNDWGLWIGGVMKFFKSFFVRQERIKVSHKRSNTRRRNTSNSTTSANSGSTATNIADQAEIDRILDKISQSGYESLNKEEKQKLFNASKKD